MKHNNIIQLFSVIQTTTTIYLVMEYSPGKELFEYIVSKRRLAETEACEFFQQILSGVDYMHKNRICHRDLKPENMLLDSNRTIKIIDFGLSNNYGKNELLGTACGSPCYAAPEMIAGNKYNGLKIDTWSMGIILYAMVCGYLPFEDVNNDALYKKILDGKFAVPSFVSEGCKDLIKKILTVDHNKRFTIQQIKEHPWFGLADPYLVEGLLINSVVIPIDEEVVEKLTEYGYPKEETRCAVLSNKHNHITTTYYLTVKSKTRNSQISISDLTSDIYLTYIHDKKNLLSNYDNDINLVVENLASSKGKFIDPERKEKKPKKSKKDEESKDEEENKNNDSHEQNDIELEKLKQKEIKNLNADFLSKKEENTTSIVLSDNKDNNIKTSKYLNNLDKIEEELTTTASISKEKKSNLKFERKESNEKELKIVFSANANNINPVQSTNPVIKTSLKFNEKDKEASSTTEDIIKFPKSKIQSSKSVRTETKSKSTKVVKDMKDSILPIEKAEIKNIKQSPNIEKHSSLPENKEVQISQEKEKSSKSLVKTSTKTLDKVSIKTLPNLTISTEIETVLPEKVIKKEVKSPPKLKIQNNTDKITKQSPPKLKIQSNNYEKVTKKEIQDKPIITKPTTTKAASKPNPITELKDNSNLIKNKRNPSMTIKNNKSKLYNKTFDSTFETQKIINLKEKIKTMKTAIKSPNTVGNGVKVSNDIHKRGESVNPTFHRRLLLSTDNQEQENKPIRNASSVKPLAHNTSSNLTSGKYTSLKSKFKNTHSPIRNVISAKKSVVNINKNNFSLVDITGIFNTDMSTMKDVVEKIVLLLGIKSIFTGGINNLYKCEKTGIKFDLSILAQKDIRLCSVLLKKKQGNNHTFKALAYNIYRKLNEIDYY